MVTRHNEEKYVIAGRFRTLKRVKSTNMTEISNSVYIDKLDDMINEYNKAYRTILLRQVHMLMLKFKGVIKMLNLKLVIM